MRFQVVAEEGSARAGLLETAHGPLETPLFMPVGTRGCVKALTREQLFSLNVKMILGNTYHLMLKPGEEIIQKAGGLHAFIDWPHALLTDSGGFQVFSLSALNKISDEGVLFQSHIDGSRHFLGPKESMRIQKTLGSDIVMAFDQCPPYPASYDEVKKAVDRTTAWARSCRDTPLQNHQNLFGIVQGGTFEDLRIASAEALVPLGFEGYAIGGLSVGEPNELMYHHVGAITPHLPANKPRYLMGVGTPRDILEAVLRGVDLFDCVMPTRNARNGSAFTWQGKLSLKSAQFKEDFSPLDPEINPHGPSRAYLRHLFNVEEITGMSLLTLHNIAFYFDFMKKLREAIYSKTLPAFCDKVSKIY